MGAIFPEDREMAKRDWECYANPAGRLAQQPTARRFAKRRADYEARASEFRLAWPGISARLSEAARFQDDFLAAVQAL